MAASQTKSSIGQRLLADHMHLDTLFERLLQDVRSGDWAACQRTWGQFEEELLDHIDVEEVYLLPPFENEHPAETAALRQEHATIGYLLADMGVRLELHAVKEPNVQRLMALLRSYAAKEDRLLYEWAKQLPSEMVAAIDRRLSSREIARPRDSRQFGAGTS
jgi:hemerythrin superfamily protein